MAQIDLGEFRTQQRDDPIVGFPRNNLIAPSRNHLTISRHFDKFVIKLGLLYREIIENSEKIQQFVLPAC